MNAQQFADALDLLARPRETGGGFHEPFVELFPVDGAAVSTLGDLLGSETISASDGVAERLDELQFDLGEGPCWLAMGTSTVVSEPDLRGHPLHDWPAFTEAVAGQDVGAMFALPMVIGPLRIGAIDLYRRDAGDIDMDALRQGEAMAGVVARRVFKDALGRVGRDQDDTPAPLSRRVLHQATGMVLAQLGLSAADARLVVEGHAFATGRSVLEVAQRIVDKDLVLDPLDRRDGDGR